MECDEGYVLTLFDINCQFLVIFLTKLHAIYFEQA